MPNRRGKKQKTNTDGNVYAKQKGKKTKKTNTDGNVYAKQKGKKTKTNYGRRCMQNRRKIFKKTPRKKYRRRCISTEENINKYELRSQQKRKYGRRGQRRHIVFKSLHSDIIAQAFLHAVNVHVIV